MRNKTYCFNTSDAVLYGLDEAIFIFNLALWLDNNKANKRNFFEGRTWSYNSYDAYTKSFPFWSYKQIRRIVKSLLKQKVIIVRHEKGSDRNKGLFYAFSDESKFLFIESEDSKIVKTDDEVCPNGQTVCPNGQTTPIYTYSLPSTDIVGRPTDNSCDFENMWNEFWKEFPNKDSKRKPGKELFLKIPNLRERFFSIMDCVRRYKKYVELQRSTGFNLKFQYVVSWLKDTDFEKDYLSTTAIKNENIPEEKPEKEDDGMTLHIKSDVTEHCQFVHQEKDIKDSIHGGMHCNNPGCVELHTVDQNGKLILLHVCPHHERLATRKGSFKYFDKILSVTTKGNH